MAGDALDRERPSRTFHHGAQKDADTPSEKLEFSTRTPEPIMNSCQPLNTTLT